MIKLKDIDITRIYNDDGSLTIHGSVQITSSYIITKSVIDTESQKMETILKDGVEIVKDKILRSVYGEIQERNKHAFRIACKNIPDGNVLIDLERLLIEKE